MKIMFRSALVVLTALSLSAPLLANNDHKDRNSTFNPDLGDGRGAKYKDKCADYLTDDQCIYYADGYYSGRRDAKKDKQHDPKEHDGAHGYMKEFWRQGYDKGFKDHH